MDKIVVIDHFFERDVIDVIIKKLDKNWRCNSLNENYINRSLSVAYNSIDLSEDVFFSIYLKGIIEQRVQKEYKTIRIMAVCQNIYQNCGFHVDHEILNKLEYDNGQNKLSNHVTFCYYINTSYEDEGSLYFRTEDNEIISIETIMNRGILFPGYLLHSPLAYTKDLNLRICITWKMELINNVD